jgi:hypothetical protein
VFAASFPPSVLFFSDRSDDAKRTSPLSVFPDTSLAAQNPPFNPNDGVASGRMSGIASTLPSQDFCGTAALPLKPDIARRGWHGRRVPIVLQNDFAHPSAQD